MQVQGSSDYDCDSSAYIASGKSIRKGDKKQITKRNKVHCTLYKMKNAINSISRKKDAGGVAAGGAGSGGAGSGGAGSGGAGSGGSRKRRITRRKKNTRRR